MTRERQRGRHGLHESRQAQGLSDAKENCLFATANKTGLYADRAIYGQGLLDLNAATNPWGVVGIMGPGRTMAQQGERASVAGSALRLSRTLGDSFMRVLGPRA